MKRLLVPLACFLLFTQAFSRTAVEDCKKGDALYNSEKYSEALKFYELATQADPNNWRAYEGLARTLSRLGREDEGNVAFRKSQDLNPNNPKYSNPLEHSKRKFSIKMGVGFSQAFGLMSLKAIPMPAIGGSYVVRRWGHRELDLELWATVRGMKSDYSTTSFYGGEKVTDIYKERIYLTCLEMPIMTKFYVDSGQHIYFLSGTSICFVLNNYSKYTFTQTRMQTNGDTQITVEQGRYPTHFSNIFGDGVVGLGVNFGRNSVEARFRIALYSFGDGHRDEALLFNLGRAF